MSEEEQIILPDGYTKVEWICNFITANTSTNCKIILPLNFDFFKDGTGDSSLIFETEHALTSLTHGQVEGISYGSTTQANNEEFFWLLYNNYIGTHAGEFISFTNLKPQIDEFIKIKLIWTPNLVTFEVTYKGETYSNSKVPTSTWSCTEIGLFHKLLGEKAQTSYKSLCGKKKYCKIWKNGELLYNLIPCLDNENTACMFDLVSQQAFYNQGTGRFVTNKDFEFGYIHTPYNLPADFKKCVYLQSDGTQWINTQVVPDSETGLYLRALRLNYGTYVSFGVNEGGNEMYPPRFDNSNLYFRWGTTSTKMMTWDKAGDFNFSSYLNFYNSKIAKFNSDDTDVYSPITSSIKTFTIPIWLFTYNVNGSYNATYGKWGGRIYRAQITQGSALIRDFVPCLDADNRPCMYDLVTQEAYYNQSGGTEFSYCVEHELPSDFVKLKYLESDGTQFIKTGYVPTNTTGMYIDAYNTINGDIVPMGCRNDTGNTRFFIARVTKSNAAGYGWGSWVSPGGTGDCRYAATLNWLNDRKSIINAPAFAQRVNNLGTLPHTPLYGINIFGANHQDTSNVLAWKGRIYRAKISEGTEIVRDYVPALDVRLHKPCMYDLINNVAYYNDGEGEFIYNRDFEGTYKGFTQLGGIGNRLGYGEPFRGNENDEEV